MSPTIAQDRQLEGSIDMSKLRLKVIKPFVDALDDVDGRLDAHVEANVTKNPKGGFQSSPEGVVTVRDGMFIADSIGSRWSNVTADIEMKSGKITVKSID